jgi:hypothetical protein
MVRVVRGGAEEKERELSFASMTQVVSYCMVTTRCFVQTVKIPTDFKSGAVNLV